VGLGGRLDTTNVVRAAVTALTAIGLDHTQVLGDTAARIAADKAGIIKSGVPVVCAPQEPSVMAVIEQAAEAAHAPLIRVGTDVSWTTGERSGHHMRFSVSIRRWGKPHVLELGTRLLGSHQRENVATAIAVLAGLRERGWAFDPSAIASGVASTIWPARFEWLSGQPALIVDGCHNPPAASVLAAALDEVFPGADRILLLGVSRDKDVVGVLRQILGKAHKVIATRSEHPRALAAADLAAIVGDLGVECVVADTPAEALEMAMRDASPEDVVVATGSLFLAAEVREAWAARGGMPMPDRDPPHVAARPSRPPDMPERT
jgi:dihydrofolate synthase / folylpolyglutamate synthase